MTHSLTTCTGSSESTSGEGILTAMKGSETPASCSGALVSLGWGDAVDNRRWRSTLSFNLRAVLSLFLKWIWSARRKQRRNYFLLNKAFLWTKVDENRACVRGRTRMNIGLGQEQAGLIDVGLHNPYHLIFCYRFHNAKSSCFHRGGLFGLCFRQLHIHLPDTHLYFNQLVSVLSPTCFFRQRMSFSFDLLTKVQLFCSAELQTLVFHLKPLFGTNSSPRERNLNQNKVQWPSLDLGCLPSLMARWRL